MIHKSWLVLFWLLVSVLSLPTSVFGQYYGDNGPESGIVVDKLISADFVNYYDNLSSDVKVLVNGNQIDFLIKVANGGTRTLENVLVVDYLPQNLVLINHPGTYIAASRKLEWNIDKLAVGETREYHVRAKIDYENNGARSQRDNLVEVRESDLFDSDKASYFVSGYQVPSSGFGGAGVGMLIAIGLTVMGVGLRKKSRGY